jgi:hypothetical protein
MRNYEKPALFADGETSRRLSTLFAAAMAFLLLVSWLLAAGVGATGA